LLEEAVMRVQSNVERRVGSVMVALLVAGGAVLGVASSAGGCGGSTTEPAATPDTTPVVVLDSSTDGGKDTKDSTVEDTTESYDVPGSIFDAPIPDVIIDGVSLPLCVDCLRTKCTSELTACDADPKCRGLTLCVLIECKGSFTDTGCLLTCAGKYGVTSPADPVVPMALAIGDCSNKNCKSECPTPEGGVPLDSGPKDSGKDATAEASMGGGGGGSFESPKAYSYKGMSIDPKVIDALQSLAIGLDGDPALKQSAIDALSH
jgi:hypothetical protein